MQQDSTPPLHLRFIEALPALYAALSHPPARELAAAAPECLLAHDPRSLGFRARYRTLAAGGLAFIHRHAGRAQPPSSRFSSSPPQRRPFTPLAGKITVLPRAVSTAWASCQTCSAPSAPPHLSSPRIRCIHAQQPPLEPSRSNSDPIRTSMLAFLATIQKAITASCTSTSSPTSM